MIAIWKRELQSYLFSPIAYIFIGAFMAIGGFLFFLANILSQSVSYTSTLSSMTFIFLFLVPILTMKLFSDEKRTKTDQLLLTSPISIWSIVVGKLLAAVSVFGITLVISFIFPVILGIYGIPAYGEIVAGYIGFLLLGTSLIAVGMFLSSLTESQVVSALMTFGVMLLMYLGSSYASAIPWTWLATIVEMLMAYARISDFILGLLSVTPTIYYLSFTFIFVFLTVRTIEKRRWSEG